MEYSAVTKKNLAHLGAFESTKIHGSGEDVLGTTRHIRLWEKDLDNLLNAGITELRYPIPWHRIERTKSDLDFSWIDGPMEQMRSNGMQPIVDPLHHTSFPDWLTDGFLNPGFPEYYGAFIAALADRYPWVQRWTVFNEPLPTTIFTSLNGMWYPHCTGDRHWVRTVNQVGRAICVAARQIITRIPDAEIVHVDTCEHHRALDDLSQTWVQFLNERRFLFLDLLAGNIDSDHVLWRYLLRNDFSESDASWFREHAIPIHVLGLDYYLHSEMEWRKRPGKAYPEFVLPTRARGFSSVAQDYIHKYHLPVMLTETNIRGTVADRLTWLRLMEEQCELLLSGGHDLRGFCWFPSIDSTDWSSCCTTCTKAVDPQGIWYLDERRWHRYESELSDVYSALARGRMRANEIPAYMPLSPVDEQLHGFAQLTSHWTDWKEQDRDQLHRAA